MLYCVCSSIYLFCYVMASGSIGEYRGKLLFRVRYCCFFQLLQLFFVCGPSLEVLSVRMCQIQNVYRKSTVAWLVVASRAHGSTVGLLIRTTVVLLLLLLS